jgi:high affinity Mn2+ porin
MRSLKKLSFEKRLAHAFKKPLARLSLPARMLGGHTTHPVQKHPHSNTARGRSGSGPSLVLGVAMSGVTTAILMTELLCSAKAADANSASVASYNWSGFYAGGHFGYGWGNSDFTATEPNATGSINFLSRSGGLLGGFQAGYNSMLSARILFGIEGDMTFPRELKGAAALSAPSIGEARYGESVQYSGTVRGRLGYIADNWLLYATGGFAASYDQFARTQIGTPSIGITVPGTVEKLKKTRMGWTAGAGIEVPFAPNWTAQLQYLLSEYGSERVTFPAAGQRFTSDLTSHDVRLAFNYQLAGDASLPPSPPQTDYFNIHGQTTYVIQGYPPFGARYDGPQSLIREGQSRETFDATLYLGLKPWPGAEIWVDPEVDQGFGLQGTLGVAGFPSAEAYKVGANDPYTRLHRIFLRQTIDLGGPTEKLEADSSHFAGMQTADRLVFTAGRFGSVDIFDTNKYANGARTDFLNWSLVNAGSFDYAADAWGYTWGAAAEWYQGRYTLRAGFFDLPIIPNTVSLDPSWKQFQAIVELEERHEFMDQPGKLKVTGFLTHARNGAFADAIKLAEATGGPADIAAVRSFRDRTGVSLNLEQQLMPNVGLFARAGVADGNIEPVAFTDIDKTLSGGLSLSGKLWGRSDDTFGVAGVVNDISPVHRSFLNAGGLGILVGDGQLPHPGLEKTIETYYSLPVFSWRATVDYQLIANPGYNQDRGPVSVIGARLHAEF